MNPGNPFKAALAAKRAQIGLWLSMAEPYLAEVSATAGFDWLLIDGEHAPNDLRSTLAALQAVAPYRSQPVVRAVSGEVALIKQLLDIGAQNLLIPMVDTAEQAARLVSATRYPPTGIRGVGSAVGRVSRWSSRTDYLDVADNEVCLLVQAETVTALRNLEAICAVDGIDGVFIGPADLAASMGYRGKPGHPEVQAAIEARHENHHRLAARPPARSPPIPGSRAATSSSDARSWRRAWTCCCMHRPRASWPPSSCSLPAPRRMSRAPLTEKSHGA